MFRASLDSDSSFVATTLESSSGGGRFRLRYRLAPGVRARTTAGDRVEMAAGWVRIERRGPTFTSWGSLDGESWVLVGEQEIPTLSASLLGGIAAMGRDARSGEYTPLRARLSNIEVVRLAAGVVPGDCNSDGSANIADVVCLVNMLFPGFNLLDRSSPHAPCATDDGNAALLDNSGNAAIDVADIVGLARLLFEGDPPPPGGSPCQLFDTELGCRGHANCQ